MSGGGRPPSRARRAAGIRAVLGFSLALACALQGRPSRGETIDEALSFYLSADFRRANDAFNAVLARQDLEVQDAARAHLHLAALALMFDEGAQARLHADAALALDPLLEPPAGSPSQLGELLEEIRERTHGRPAEIDIRLEGPLEPDGPAEVFARLVPAPRLLATTLSLECTTADGATFRESGPPPEVDLELSGVPGVVHCVSTALSDAGATLIQASLETSVEVQQPVEFTPEAPEPARPRRRWGLWFGVSAGVVATVAIVAIVLSLTLANDDVVLRETTIEGW